MTRRLRLPIPEIVALIHSNNRGQGNNDMRCPLCKEALIDVYGDHLAKCIKSNQCSNRHNAVRDTLLQIIRTSGITSTSNLDNRCIGVGFEERMNPANETRCGDLTISRARFLNFDKDTIAVDIKICNHTIHAAEVFFCCLKLRI